MDRLRISRANAAVSAEAAGQNSSFGAPASSHSVPPLPGGGRAAELPLLRACPGAEAFSGGACARLSCDTWRLGPLARWRDVANTCNAHAPCRGAGLMDRFQYFREQTAAAGSTRGDCCIRDRDPGGHRAASKARAPKSAERGAMGLCGFQRVTAQHRNGKTAGHHLQPTRWWCLYFSQND